MRKMLVAGFLVICAAGSALAQPPRKLPSSLDDPKHDRPLSPAEAAKLRENAISGLKEELVSFEPSDIQATQVEGRWKLQTRAVTLKDFGADRASALEAARIVRDLGFNQFGTVPGAQPSFEYWLTEGKAPRSLNSRITILPIAARAIHAESVGGAWVLSDGTKALYDFGADADAAKRAAIVFWKYGFNEVGLVGAPRPAMYYPLFDARQAALEKASPMPPSSPLGVAGDVARTSLLLPGNIYAGAKSPFDVKKLETIRTKTGEWTLTYAGDVLARFGSVESSARGAMKFLQDVHANEIVHIGEGGFPFFLVDGQPIHGDPLGVTKTVFRGDRLKVQKVRETWWLFDDIRPLVEIGSKADAELMLRVIRQYDLKCLCLFGRPELGGLRLLTTGR
jgi:hypothetical protein